MKRYIFSLVIVVTFVSLISLDNPSSPLDKEKEDSSPFVEKTPNFSNTGSAAWSAAKRSFLLTGTGIAIGHANSKKKRPGTPAVGGGIGALVGIGAHIQTDGNKQEDNMIAKFCGSITGTATAFLVASLFNIFV